MGQKKTTPLLKKAGEAKVSSMVATDRSLGPSIAARVVPEGRRGVKCQFVGSLGCTSVHPPTDGASSETWPLRRGKTL